jgi:hypothetical protein
MGLLDPHCQSDSLHPYKVCLIVNDGGNGAFLILLNAHQVGRARLTFNLVIPV